MIQDVCSRDEISGRASLPSLNKARGSKDPDNPDTCPGLIMSNGKVWQEQRRFCLQALRDLGYGKKGMEEHVMDEVGELQKFLESTGGQPIDTRNRFNIIVVNALWTVMTGERLSPEDPKLPNLLSLLDQLIREVDNPLLSLVKNSLAWVWVTKQLGLPPPTNVFDEIIKFMQEIIRPNRKSYQDDSVRNLIDHFIRMSKKQEVSREQMSFVGEDGELNLQSLLLDLFVAGSESTSNSLNWAMLFLLLNPGVQERIHKELDEAIGPGMQPCYDDRIKTPYTEAVIHEVMRLGNLTDRGVPHVVTKDCYLNSGHFLPRGTIVFCWTTPVHMDPKHFLQPHKFDPTRFIDDNGKFKPHPRLIPFGLGKRRCLGEALAKVQMYDFFTGVMVKFRVEKANPQEELSTVPIEGATMTPQPFKLKFIPRH